MKLPKSFGELTVKQYQEATEILGSDLDQLDKHVKLIACLSDTSIDKVEALTPKEIMTLAEQLNFLNDPKMPTTIYKRVIANGRLYVGQMEAQKLNAGQLITLKTLQERNEPTKYLHQMLGCVYSPMNWRGKAKKGDSERTANDMLSVKLKNVYGLLFFYSRVWENSTPIIQTSFNEAIATINKALKKNGQALVLKT